MMYNNLIYNYKNGEGALTGKKILIRNKDSNQFDEKSVNAELYSYIYMHMSLCAQFPLY